MALSPPEIQQSREEEDYLKSIPLRIFTKGTGNCAYSNTVTGPNSDTANEVIHMSLSMLGMTASERDYRFWLSSGKEALYLLIGHEYPYGSKKSLLQDIELLTLVSKGPISPSNLQQPFLMDQQLGKMQHQSILKPGRLVAAQQLSG